MQIPILWIRHPIAIQNSITIVVYLAHSWHFHNFLCHFHFPFSTVTLIVILQTVERVQFSVSREREREICIFSSLRRRRRRHLSLSDWWCWCVLCPVLKTQVLNKQSSTSVERFYNLHWASSASSSSAYSNSHKGSASRVSFIIYHRKGCLTGVQELSSRICRSCYPFFASMSISPATLCRYVCVCVV